jgi:hypothetical protein
MFLPLLEAYLSLAPLLLPAVWPIWLRFPLLPEAFLYWQIAAQPSRRQLPAAQSKQA